MLIHIRAYVYVYQVKKIFVKQRENAIVNRLNKTRTEKFPDLRQEKEKRLRELRKRDQAARSERVRKREENKIRSPFPSPPLSFSVFLFAVSLR